MSVVKSKRGQGKLLVYTRANELAVYTIQICANEKHFPKRYRWCITNKIVDWSEPEYKENADIPDPTAYTLSRV